MIRCCLCTMCDQSPTNFMLGWSGCMWSTCGHWLKSGMVDRRCPIMFSAHSVISTWHMICLQHLARASWWRHQMETFSALLAICPVPVNFPHKGQWRGALMFSLVCTRINGWVNNGEAGDLRRYRAYYNVTVMLQWAINLFCLSIRDLNAAMPLGICES